MSTTAREQATADSDAYDRKRATAAERSRRESEAGRDIGPPPKVANKKRRAKAFDSLLAFCSYFPDRFPLKFSPDQLEVIETAERVITTGGTEPVAMPRGSGKTQICITAIEWGALTGRRRFSYLLGATLYASKRLMLAIKRDLLTNDRLFEDWPEVCHPIREMDDRANRCKGQHIAGKKTWMTWASDTIVLPVVEGSVASSNIICVMGLGSSNLRGSNFARPADGKTVRPELVILDDVQDDKIAAKPMRVEKMLNVIKGTILGMAGPGEKIAVLAPCTVIQTGDVADQLLDRKLNPEWRGKKYKLLYSFPTNMPLWDEYANIRAESFRADGDGSPATAFYKKHRAEMDAGAVMAWPERFDRGEISGIQYAMNLYYRNPDQFFAEYQNEPRTNDSSKEQLRKDELLAILNGIDRFVIPAWATHLVGFIDVQKTLLYWLIAAYADDFTGAIVDYGTWPEQTRKYFLRSDAAKPFAKAYPGMDLAGAIRKALDDCSDFLVGREWTRQGGGRVDLDRLLVDTGFMPDTVYDWARASPHKAIILPSRGLPIGVKSKPLSEYSKKPGEVLKFHWRIPLASATRGVKTIQTDVNFWKSFVRDRLRLAVGSKGGISVFGRPGADGRPGTDHRLLVDHLTSEFFTTVTANGRSLEEWAGKPGEPDNDWWDCLVGSTAGASFLGAAVHGSRVEPKKPKRFKDVKDWQRYKQQKLHEQLQKPKPN